MANGYVGVNDRKLEGVITGLKDCEKGKGAKVKQGIRQIKKGLKQCQKDPENGLSLIPHDIYVSAMAFIKKPKTYTQ